MRAALLPFLMLIPLTACSSGGEEPAADDAAPADARDALTAMREDIQALEAKAEHTSERVLVQHILIAYGGAPRMPPTVTRSKEEAEALAADLYARIQAGEDFTRLMSEHSDDDKVVGQYLMSLTEPTRQRPEVLYNRYNMAPAFGNVGWRLEVGEIGVAPENPQTSPYGWHIIKRLE